MPAAFSLSITLNPYQVEGLVYLVQVNLAAGATVTESKMLVDRLTGTEREVDVCIEGVVGGHPVKVCIECRDHERPADVTWVDAMKSKHERLPTNALILASRTGFTSEGQQVAHRYGIEAVSLLEVEQTDFPNLLKASSSLWNKTVALTAQKVIVRVLPTPTLAAENVAVIPDTSVHAHDGTELGPISEFVQTLLRSPAAGKQLLSKGNQEHTWFELRWEPPRDHLGNPLFLRKIEPPTLREIEYIEITGLCRFIISEFGLRRGTLGEIQLAWGKTEILGRDAIVVATRDDAGLEKLSLHIAGTPSQIGASDHNSRL
jgi:hypothetical protein